MLRSGKRSCTTSLVPTAEEDREAEAGEETDAAYYPEAYTSFGA